MLPAKTEKTPNVTLKFLSHMKTRLLNMTWSNLGFNVLRYFVTMVTNLPFCFNSIFRTSPEVFIKLYFVEMS